MNPRRSVRFHISMAAGIGAVLIALAAGPAVAHVKWFSAFDFRDEPQSFSDILGPAFFIALALAAVVIGALPAIDRWLDTVDLYVRINDWLSERRNLADRILAIMVAASLILAWSSQALLAPELAEPAGWVGWFQLVLAILLIVGRTDRLVGAGIGLLWLIGVFSYGAMHMLDYVSYVGIAAFVALRASDDSTTRGLGLPVLYATVGFSLMWLGFEKLVYPDWALAVLDTRPVLRLGLPVDFFLHLAAFVEISLGFLLIIGLLGRPLALTITGVFISTTIIFGRVEVIGHTPLHAALIVFLLQGAGRVYPAPISIHKNLKLRMAFASVNMVILTLLVGVLYSAAARSQFNDAVAERGPAPEAIDAVSPVPSVRSIELIETPGGTDVVIEIDGFTFVAPDAEAPTDDPSTGFGILSLDADVVARITGPASPVFTEVEGRSAVLTLFTVTGRPIVSDDGPLRIPVQL